MICTIVVHYYVHGSATPLHLIENIQRGMNDEGVLSPLGIAEAWSAVATLFGGAEFGGEERVVFCAQDTEVEGHGGSGWGVRM